MGRSVSIPWKYARIWTPRAEIWVTAYLLCVQPSLLLNNFATQAAPSPSATRLLHPTSLLVMSRTRLRARLPPHLSSLYLSARACAASLYISERLALIKLPPSLNSGVKNRSARLLLSKMKPGNRSPVHPDFSAPPEVAFVETLTVAIMRGQLGLTLGRPPLPFPAAPTGNKRRTREVGQEKEEERHRQRCGGAGLMG